MLGVVWTLAGFVAGFALGLLVNAEEVRQLCKENNRLLYKVLVLQHRLMRGRL